MKAKNQANRLITPENLWSALIFLVIFSILFIILNVPWGYLYTAGYITSAGLEYISSASLSFTFSLSVLFYFFVYRKVKPVNILSMLGLGKSSISISNVALGFLILSIVLVFEFAVTAITVVTGVAINSNVGLVFGSAPLWVLIFSSIIAPINEEILFRGFLVPRIGILASAVIFGFAHFTYNSSFGIEIIAAFLFALISGYVYKRTNSLYPSIVAHILVNVTTFIALMVIL